MELCSYLPIIYYYLYIIMYQQIPLTRHSLFFNIIIIE